jgi:hypothetical protein
MEQDMVQWQALVNTAESSGSIKAGNFLISKQLSDSEEGSCSMEVTYPQLSHNCQVAKASLMSDQLSAIYVKTQTFIVLYI